MSDFSADNYASIKLADLPEAFPERNVGLTPEQKFELARLIFLSKPMDWTGPVFHAQLDKTISLPIELIIMNPREEVLLVWREDAEFTGWHFPGSCMNEWDTMPLRRQKLIAGEVIKGTGAKIGEPVFMGEFP